MKNYFSHDYNARNDKKLVVVFMRHGLAGIGAYWCIVEMLYEEGGYLLLNEYERISFELRIDINVIRDIIERTELFQNDGERFWSESCLNRLNERASKSVKARESIEYRWNKLREKSENTNVLHTNESRNTNKEKKSKVKERKEYKKSLLSEIEISDFPEINNDYFEIAKSFQLLFKNNLIEAGSATTLIDKANGKWIDDVRLMIENDKYTIEDLRAVYFFLQRDSFWKQNILSISKLREKMPQLKLKIYNGNGNGNSRTNNKEATSWGELAQIVADSFANRS